MDRHIVVCATIVSSLALLGCSSEEKTPMSAVSDFFSVVEEFDSDELATLTCTDSNVDISSQGGTIRSLFDIDVEGTDEISVRDLQSRVLHEDEDAKQVAVEVEGSLVEGDETQEHHINEVVVMAYAENADAWCVMGSTDHLRLRRTPVFRTALLEIALRSDQLDQRSEAVVYLDSEARKTVGPQEVEIRILIDTAERIAGFDFALRFDPSKLEIHDFNLGDFIGSTGRDPECVDSALEPDSVAYTCVTFGPPACSGGIEGASGAGTLATLRVEPLVTGESLLDLETVTLSADKLVPCDETGVVPEIPSVASDAVLSVQLAD